MSANSKVFLLILFLLLFQKVGAQKDSSDMKFDFGWTRDVDINLWPVLKFKKDTAVGYVKTDVLFSIYQFKRDKPIQEKYSHFYPIWRKKDNINEQDFRLFSLFYPSLLHFGNDKLKGIKSFDFIELAPDISFVGFSKSADGLYVDNNLLFLLWYKRNETEKSSTLIFFPFYWSFDSPKRSSNTFFPLWSSGNSDFGSKKYTAITPLFWHLKSGNSTSNLFVPLFYGKRSVYDSVVEKQHVFFPLVWTRRSPSVQNFSFFPIVFSHRNPESNALVVFPLAANFRSKVSDKRLTGITPLFWNYKSGNETGNVFLPIYWNQKRKDSLNPSKRTVLLPFWYSYSDANKSNRVFFPIAYRFKNQDYKSFTVFPLISSGKDNSDNRSYSMITPLFWKTKYYDEHYTRLLPIWFSYTDSLRKNRVFFPLVFYSKKPDYRSFTFIPFFSKGSDSLNVSKHFAVTPFFWHWENEYRVVNTFIPVFWNIRTISKSNPKHRTAFFPIFFQFKDNRHQNWTVFPLLYSRKSTNYQSFTFLPFFSKGQSPDSSRNHLSVATLYWQFSNDNQNLRTLFPLWWNYRRVSGEDHYTFNIIFPVYWSINNPRSNNKVVFPLVWSLKNRYYQSFSFIPLVSAGRSTNRQRKHLSITPLFWHFKEYGDSYTTLFPLIWLRNEKGEFANRQSIIVPLWYSFRDSTRRNSVFFPFAWKFKNPDYKTIGVFPLFASGNSADEKNSFYSVSPLYWHFRNDKRTNSLLFPLFWFEWDGGENAFKRTFVFPVFYAFRDSQYQKQMLFPFYFRYKNPEYQSLTIFPMISTGASPDHSAGHFVFTPLFWHFKNTESKKTVLFPVFDSKHYVDGNSNFGLFYFLFRYKKFDDQKRADLLWPICQYKSGADLKSFRFAPIIWYKKTSDYRFFSIQPFYYQRKTKDYADYHLLWQLFTFRNEYNTKKSWNFLWKAVYYDKYADNGHEFRFLYLVFADVKKNGMVEKSFFPIYYFSKESNGNRSLSLFLYFYNSFRRQIPNSLEFYKEERIFWFIRLRSNYKRLKAEGKL